MTQTSVQKTSGAGAVLSVGIILLLAGIAGIASYLVLAFTGTPGEASGEGAAQGLLLWGAALSCGVGAALVVIGVLKRRRSGATPEG
jgi:uncharacterized membrane protein YphA (DoxX/SURF4 family)